MRADFLARAGAILDASLDYEETLRSVAADRGPRGRRLVRGERPRRRRRAAGGRHRARRPEPARARRRDQPPLPARPDARTAARYRVARSGETELRAARSPTRCSSPASPTPSTSTLVRRLGPALGHHRAAAAPAAATFGTFTPGQRRVRPAASSRPTSSSPRSSRARAGDGDRQRPALHRAQPHRPHAAGQAAARAPARDPAARCMAARYRAAGELNEVGGDFYDVFPRSPTEWALVVGDVSGKGAGGGRRHRAGPLHAARRARSRTTPPERRPAAAQHRDAATTTRRSSPPSSLAYRRRRPDGEHRRAPRAGRPPAAGRRAPRRDASRCVGPLRRRCSALRARHRRCTTSTSASRPGDVLLLYTDGVTEAGPRRTPFGEAGLRRLLSALARRSRRRPSSTPSSAPWSPRSRASRATTSRCSPSG